MKIYWTSKSIPELAELTPAMRRLALHDCGPKIWTHWQTWLGAAASLCVGLLGGFVVLWGLLNLDIPMGSRYIRLFIAGMASGIAIAGMTYLFFGLVKGSQVRPYLRAYLAEQKSVAASTTPQ